MIVLVSAAVTCLALVLIRRIPPVYKTDALIVVDSQKIPGNYVASTVTSDAQDRLATITLEILSNGQLQKIIDDFGLYAEQRKTHFPEDVLQMMRKDLDVAPEPAWTGRTASFRISYQGSDPEVVAKVTNRLAEVFVHENLKNREVQAEGTTEFIESQLKEAKAKLDQMDAALAQYKMKHNGELPEQEQSLNAALGRLQSQLQANADAMNRAQQNKVAYSNDLAAAEDMLRSEQSRLRAELAATAATQVLAPVSPGAPRRIKKSEELEAKLADLRLHYGEAYPDIVRLKAQIAQAKLEESAAGSGNDGSQPDVPVATASAPAPKAPPSPKASPAPELTSPEIEQTKARIVSLKSQMELVGQDLKRGEAEQRRILGDIAEYQNRVGALPLREQEMSQLTRDYENSKANYRTLLDKKINAEMATEMEVRQKSERFTIADPARVPARPFKPDRRLLYGAGAAVGLLMALLLAFAVELHEATLLGEWELPAGATVLGRLPFVEITPNVQSSKKTGGGGRRALNLASLSSALVSLLGALAGIYFIAGRS